MQEPGEQDGLSNGAAGTAGHLGLLASLSEAFARSLDLSATLRHAVSEIGRYMHAEAASLFLIDEAGNVLECRASAGPVQIQGLRLGIDQGIVGKTVRENRVQLIRDARKDPDFAGFVDAETGFRTRSIMCAPLSVHGNPIGALEVINRDFGDHLFDQSDGQLLSVLATSAALVIHNARMAAELVEQQRMRQELELGREIQAGLLPAARPAPFPIAGINVPALEVSGDFYDFYDLPDGRFAFSLGDVSGKGVNAALLCAKASSLLHCLGKTYTDPAGLLVLVNEELCESTTRGMFVTLVAGVYDPLAGRVVLANAGHQPPLLRRADGSLRPITAASPPAGIMSGLSFVDVDLSLDGGALYLYTDGVTEGAGRDGRPLGVAGLAELLARFSNLEPRQRLARVVSEINNGEIRRKDDVTLMVIEAAP